MKAASIGGSGAVGSGGQSVWAQGVETATASSCTPAVFNALDKVKAGDLDKQDKVLVRFKRSGQTKICEAVFLGNKRPRGFTRVAHVELDNKYKFQVSYSNLRRHDRPDQTAVLERNTREVSPQADAPPRRVLPLPASDRVSGAAAAGSRVSSGRGKLPPKLSIINIKLKKRVRLIGQQRNTVNIIEAKPADTDMQTLTRRNDKLLNKIDSLELEIYTALLAEQESKKSEVGSDTVRAQRARFLASKKVRDFLAEYSEAQAGFEPAAPSDRPDEAKDRDMAQRLDAQFRRAAAVSYVGGYDRGEGVKAPPAFDSRAAQEAQEIALALQLSMMEVAHSGVAERPGVDDGGGGGGGGDNFDAPAAGGTAVEEAGEEWGEDSIEVEPVVVESEPDEVESDEEPQIADPDSNAFDDWEDC